MPDQAMAMSTPCHPGEIVKYECLEPLDLSVTAGARVLGVTRQALSNLINGNSGVSPEMAVRLEKAFGGTAETWLRMQVAYDLARVRKTADTIDVRRYEPA